MEMQPWHRLFGLSWMDFFRGMPVEVQMEVDLSKRQQLLDIVILRKTGDSLPVRLPDGFEDLAAHNLITFKSYQDSLDGWALSELIGHYVNYRKQAGPSMQHMPEESQFRLFAVSVRYPQGLARSATLTRIRPGVYEVIHFTGTIRVIVVQELPEEEHNAMLHLFSTRSEQIRYGAEHYRIKSTETSSLLRLLLQRYQSEGSVMPDALEQLTIDTIREVLAGMTFEERLKGVPIEERLKGVPTEERLKGVPTEERLKGVSPDELLAALPSAERAELLRRLQSEKPASE